jgi:hypothetical protein
VLEEVLEEGQAPEQTEKQQQQRKREQQRHGGSGEEQKGQKQRREHVGHGFVGVPWWCFLFFVK